MEEEKDATSSPKEKESMKFRFKKFVASKLSASSGGRSLIKSLAGPQASQMMNAVTSTMIKFSGKQTATVMQLYIFKMATKCATYFHERRIVDKMLESCKEANIILVTCVLEELQIPANKRHPFVVNTLVAECYKVLHSLFEQLLGAESSARLTALRDYLLSGYIDYFLMSTECETERNVILINLQSFMQPFENDTGQSLAFIQCRLQQRQRDLMMLVSMPSLRAYLNNRDTFKLLCEWFMQSSNILIKHSFQLYVAIQKYRTVTSKALLRQRAMKIYDHYISEVAPSHVPVPKPLVDTVENHLNLDDYPLVLYAEVSNYILGQLDIEFQNTFTSSEHYTLLQEELDLVNQKLSACFHNEIQLDCDISEALEEEFVGSYSIVDRFSFWK